MTEENVENRLSVHEAVCAERYSTMLGRIGRLETIIIAVAGALLCGMASLVVVLLTRGAS